MAEVRVPAEIPGEVEAVLDIVAALLVDIGLDVLTSDMAHGQLFAVGQLVRLVGPDRLARMSPDTEPAMYEGMADLAEQYQP